MKAAAEKAVAGQDPSVDLWIRLFPIACSMVRAPRPEPTSSAWPDRQLSPKLAARKAAAPKARTQPGLPSTAIAEAGPGKKKQVSPIQNHCSTRPVPGTVATASFAKGAARPETDTVFSYLALSPRSLQHPPATDKRPVTAFSVQPCSPREHHTQHHLTNHLPPLESPIRSISSFLMAGC